MVVATDERAECLRAWARHSYPHEAAAELLIRALGGRLLDGPWIQHDGRGGWWFDTSAVDEAGAYLSGGEWRILALAASLADRECLVPLHDVVDGLSRGDLDLVLAAIAHANGSHEAAPVTWHHHADGTATVTRHPKPGSAHPWPGGEQSE